MGPDCDVIVVGAGLSGLTAARQMHRRGLNVAVFEAADDVGGRIRTDHVDGFQLDRGFQVLCPSYPALRTHFDVPALRLMPFRRGIGVVRDGRVHAIGLDPRSVTTVPQVTSPRGGLALAALAARDMMAAPRTLRRRPDRSTLHELHAAGLDATTIDTILRPFLSGVFLESKLETSGRFFHLVFRCFLRGGAAVPTGGMAALPRQIATGFPPATLRCATPVAAAHPRHVVLADGDTVTARAVLIATDATAAANLCGTAEPQWHGVTTFYHAAPSAPREDALLIVDADKPLICNTVVLSNAAPSYAPPGASLIATSVLDTAAPIADIEPAVRSRLAVIYGPTARAWDLLATYRVPHALPAMPAPHPLRRRVRLRGKYVCGDHRDTSSIQGALISGRRAADAILADLL